MIFARSTCYEREGRCEKSKIQTRFRMEKLFTKRHDSNLPRTLFSNSDFEAFSNWAITTFLTRTAISFFKGEELQYYPQFDSTHCNRIITVPSQHRFQSIRKPPSTFFYPIYNITMSSSASRIEYSEKYADDMNEYR